MSTQFILSVITSVLALVGLFLYHRYSQALREAVLPRGPVWKGFGIRRVTARRNRFPRRPRFSKPLRNDEGDNSDDDDRVSICIIACVVHNVLLIVALNAMQSDYYRLLQLGALIAAAVLFINVLTYFGERDAVRRWSWPVQFMSVFPLIFDIWLMWSAIQ